jgi:hypothetical protein
MSLKDEDDVLIDEDERRFREFHRENPGVYDLMVRFSREMRRAGWNRYSIWGVANRVRWETHIQTSDPDFKINNNHLAFYSRLIMQQCPDLAGFFRIRVMRRRVRAWRATG